MNNTLSFEDWVRAHGQRTELALDNLLDAANTNPARLHEAMRYAAQGGGKRIRPLLVYAAGALSDDTNQSALDAAAVAIALREEVGRRGATVLGELFAVPGGGVLSAVIHVAAADAPHPVVGRARTN